MLQDPNVERYVANAIKPLQNKIRKMEVEIEKLKQIKNMEKIILVHYINIGNSDDMENIIKKLSPNERNDIFSYFIPIIEGETRVECINPKLGL